MWSQTLLSEPGNDDSSGISAKKKRKKKSIVSQVYKRKFPEAEVPDLLLVDDFSNVITYPLLDS